MPPGPGSLRAVLPWSATNQTELENSDVGATHGTAIAAYETAAWEPSTYALPRSGLTPPRRAAV